jgi:hypothetical protein
VDGNDIDTRTMRNNSMEIDFEAWSKLAKDDPAEFERRREFVLRSAIDSAPAAFRPRLEGLQGRLDLERRRAATPLASCVRLNTLMWAGFFRLRRELANASSRTPPSTGAPRQSAQIIPLRSGRGLSEGAAQGAVKH